MPELSKRGFLQYKILGSLYPASDAVFLEDAGY
jgi:hypothetical protein